MVAAAASAASEIAVTTATPCAPAARRAGTWTGMTPPTAITGKHRRRRDGRDANRSQRVGKALLGPGRERRTHPEVGRPGSRGGVLAAHLDGAGPRGQGSAYVVEGVTAATGVRDDVQPRDPAVRWRPPQGTGGRVRAKTPWMLAVLAGDDIALLNSLRRHDPDQVWTVGAASAPSQPGASDSREGQCPS